MLTLGINAAFHDSAACLVRDGAMLAAAEEERFTRVKHAKRPIPFSAYELPFHAIDFCLAQTGARLADVDHIAYSYDPAIRLHGNTDAQLILPLSPSAHAAPSGWESPWDPLFVSSIVNAPRYLVGGVPHHLAARFRGARHDGPYRWHFVNHHLAHAASAFHASPFEDAAIMVIDGRGESATTSYAYGQGVRMERLGQVEMPHSLGLLYERVTEHLGFLHSSDEYKVMALASFGKPRYLEVFRRAIAIGDAGQYRIATLDLKDSLGPARHRGEAITQAHFDIAASLQAALEESALALASWLHATTGSDHLCLAGGVALNCVMNAALRDRGPFRRVWVQPAAGDAGTALGAALWVDLRQRRAARRDWRMDHVFLGPAYSDEHIERVLRQARLRYRRMENVAHEVAALLARKRVVGWFQGPMEFGPRALGARSILASPLDGDMQTRLNAIKDREDFRPVAPVVLEEEAANWFTGCERSPFMLFVNRVAPDKEDAIPAVRHIDGTARVQTLNRAQHARYYDLVKAFAARTGVPVLINTSFNTRGEPIVCTPEHAIASFYTTPIDALAIGSYLLEKD